jgi:hypothetical protein
MTISCPNQLVSYRSTGLYEKYIIEDWFLCDCPSHTLLVNTFELGDDHSANDADMITEPRSGELQTLQILEAPAGEASFSADHPYLYMRLISVITVLQMMHSLR